MKKWIQKWMPSKRKIMQLYFALLFNANLKGFISGSIFKGQSKILCAPGINCYSCPGAVGACPLGSLQGAFSAKNRSTLFYVAGILLLYSILFGRMICGWLCPFGLIQELVYKINTPKIRKSPITRVLSYFKYAILVFFVFIVPITYGLRNVPLPAFCKYICPAGTIEGGLLLLSHKANAGLLSILGPLFTWKFLLMVSIMVGCVFIFRLFCRFICPLGALYGLFNKLSVFGVGVDNAKCTNCGLCQAKCKVDIRTVGDQECISCGECISVCPTQAIGWKGPKIFLAPKDSDTQKQKKAKRITRSISAILLVAALLGMIGYSWVSSGNNLPPEGNQVGDLCYSYDLELIDENGATGQMLNPSQTGKITIINFWGTWCGPCVKELPYFRQIAEEYGDDVTVVAIHSAGLSATAPAYIAENYPDSKLLFSWEKGETESQMDGEFYLKLGGLSTYPYTLILDENGVIQYIFLSSVHYEDLQTAVEALMK